MRSAPSAKAERTTSSGGPGANAQSAPLTASLNDWLSASNRRATVARTAGCWWTSSFGPVLWPVTPTLRQARGLQTEASCRLM